jgi:hypothetical protein
LEDFKNRFLHRLLHWDGTKIPAIAQGVGYSGVVHKCLGIR